MFIYLFNIEFIQYEALNKISRFRINFPHIL